MQTISTVPFSMRIDRRVKKSLDLEAKKLDRTASYVVSKAIKSYLDSKENERLAIQDALRKADKGEFISS
ncbi:MAG: hypothetical protein R3F02_12315 [Thiolinea sp.]